MRGIPAFLLLVTFFPTAVFSQFSVFNEQDARLITEPSGIRDRNNGGNTATGRLIGINTGLVDNFMIFNFPSLVDFAGQSVSGATVTLQPQAGFSNGNHGTVDDLIHLNEIALPNDGWIVGENVIMATDNFTDDGSVSYANRVEYLDGSANGTAEPWLDANGDAVANLEGTFNRIGTVNGWNEGEAPESFSFGIDPVMAQSWIDSGLAGLAISNTDNGDNRSRFNLAPLNGAEVEILFEVGGDPGGDFDGNGSYDCADVDALVGEIAGGTNAPGFDISGDGLVDGVDLTAWLLEAGNANIGPGQAYLEGDANLDGSVDVGDFNIWNGSKFTTTPEWCSGDFNADGSVDVGDFNIWNGNKFQSSDFAAVPEPGGLILAFLGLPLLYLHRRRRA